MTHTEERAEQLLEKAEAWCKDNLQETWEELVSYEARSLGQLIWPGGDGNQPAYEFEFPRAVLIFHGAALYARGNDSIYLYWLKECALQHEEHGYWAAVGH